MLNNIVKGKKILSVLYLYKLISILVEENVNNIMFVGLRVFSGLD